MREFELSIQAPAYLEVIACSLTDAIEAEKGGANRLELVRELDRGGLTPPIGLVMEILSAVHIPARVMLRESDGFEVKGGTEVETLCGLARELSRLSVDGLVLGFLRDGMIDDGLLKLILNCAPGKRVTFHHAFDATTDPLMAIEALKAFRQVDRILTSGGSGDWGEKAERLALYVRAAQPEIEVLVGGGVDARAIEIIRGASAVREFHVGRAARAKGQASEDVVAERVARLASILRNCPPPEDEYL